MSGIELRRVRTADLVANRRNIREHLDDIDELAASIRANGLLQPLIVNDQAGTLVVTDGHRRLAACQRAHVPTVVCLVTTDADARRVTTTMLAAAMHQGLKPLEQARAFHDLRAEGLTVLDIARATGYSTGLIRQRLLLLELPDDAQDLVEDQTLTIGQATTLAKQVKATKTGSVTKGNGRSAWLTKAHPLALSITCDHRDTRTIIGSVACGQCWEASIRADERGDLDVIPVHDEALVQRVLTGERLPMQRADRLECTRRLVTQQLSDTEIAARLHVTKRQALRDRQSLNLAAPVESGSGFPKAAAS
jgi:ParB/RepB/Spo0J family partition protein